MQLRLFSSDVDGLNKKTMAAPTGSLHTLSGHFSAVLRTQPVLYRQRCLAWRGGRFSVLLMLEQQQKHTALSAKGEIRLIIEIKEFQQSI